MSASCLRGILHQFLLWKCYRKGEVGYSCCSKANKQARSVERKVCFISDATNLGRWGGHLSKGWLPPPPSPHTHMATSGARAFIARRRGLHAETAQPALTVIFRLVISGLTSVILIVLGTVSLQFQGPLVPISLWPVLSIVTAHVLGIVWSSCS